MGSKTGRDGIHGATMASAEFDEDTEEKRPTVQVGDPFTEKLLIEACLELMETDTIVAIQDMGAAGLTCSSFEMCSKGGTGIELDLDAVPIREEGMTPYEIMLSESQERMLMVLKPGKEGIARAIFEKWELDFAIVGHLTDTGRMVLKKDGKSVADMPIDPLAEASPEYDRPWVPSEKSAVVVSDSMVHGDWTEALKTLIGAPDLASRRWVWEQYDHMVMGDTVQRPGGDAAVVRIHGSDRGLAITSDCTPRYVKADPFEGGKQAVAETFRNLTATGAKPLAITDNLNFGNPEKPSIMGQLVEAVKGIGEACRVLDTPVVSGNVSLYNETDGQPILPTPTIGAIGVIDSLDKAATVGFKGEGDAVLVIGGADGTTDGWLGQSLYLRELYGREDGAPPPVDLAQERKVGDAVRSLIQSGQVSTCHDIADGGIAIALTEMALAGGIGVTIDAGDDVSVPWLFGEDQGRYVLTCAADQAEAMIETLTSAGVTARQIGVNGGDTVSVAGSSSVGLATLRDLHEGWFPAYMAA